MGLSILKWHFCLCRKGSIVAREFMCQVITSFHYLLFWKFNFQAQGVVLCLMQSSELLHPLDICTHLNFMNSELKLHKKSSYNMVWYICNYWYISLKVTKSSEVWTCNNIIAFANNYCFRWFMYILFWCKWSWSYTTLNVYFWKCHACSYHSSYCSIDIGSNVTVTHRDVCQDGFKLDHVADAVFLDLPKPWEVIKSAKQALKKEGKIQVVFIFIWKIMWAFLSGISYGHF